jgi:predicted nuclease of restriction endonuclease-like RecB superfamily
LQKKLAKLRVARIANLIVCVDEARNCGSEALPANARVLRYRRRVPADQVLRVIERR